MAFLTGVEITKQIEKGNIRIDPFDPKRMQANSYDLALANKLLVYKLWDVMWRLPREQSELLGDEWHAAPKHLDMRRKNQTLELTIPEKGLLLVPQVLYLGSTIEWTDTRGFVPCLEGRSSVGRLGVTVHQTAGFGDNFFRGRWTLEITVTHPIIVYANTPVAQISYTTLEGEQTPYRGRYLDQQGAEASRLHRDYREVTEG